MIEMSPYELQQSNNVSCPKCKKTAYLLSHRTFLNLPAFYICFDCKYIGEVGVGEVAEITEAD